jgi:hypothetical protein
MLSVGTLYSKIPLAILLGLVGVAYSQDSNNPNAATVEFFAGYNCDGDSFTLECIGQDGEFCGISGGAGSAMMLQQEGFDVTSNAAVCVCAEGDDCTTNLGCVSDGGCASLDYGTLITAMIFGGRTPGGDTCFNSC